METGRTNANVLAAVLPVIVRIESVVSDENAMLRSGKPGPIKQYSERKNQGLLELSNALVMLRPSEAEGKSVVDALASFVGKLEENKRLLQLHYEALRDLARVFATAAEEEMSDRTYSASRRSRRPEG